MSVKKIAFMLVSFSIFLVSCGGGGGGGTADPYSPSPSYSCAYDYFITAIFLTDIISS